MKILSLVAENVKRLVAVEIRPDGNLVQITGKNGQGKTSVLDSIWWCLTGATHVQAVPIRHGATEARIRLDLGDLIATRTFKVKDGGEYTTSIEVKNADGAKFPSPQRMLDGLIDSLAFDPLAFARMEPRAQFDALRKFVPGVDFEKIDMLNKADYDARTEANRKAKDARAAAAQIVVPDNTPADPVDTAKLVAELEKAGQHNASIERQAAERNGRGEKAAALKQSAAACHERARKLREQADAEEAKASAFLADAAAIEQEAKTALPSRIDTKPLRAKIEEAQATNKAVELRKRKSEHQHLAQLAETQSKKLTDQINGRVAERTKAIAAAKMPVEGLGFGDGSITFKGLPFEQASDAEQLSVGVAIAMATNSKLRVIRIRDGSLLDDDRMVQLGELAAKFDMQVWIERVDSSGQVGFVIEDGHVLGVPPATAIASANGVHPETFDETEEEEEEEGVPF